MFKILLFISDHMVKTTSEKQQGRRKEVIPKGNDFMPQYTYWQIRRAHKKEPPGKPQLILEVCKLWKSGRSIWEIVRTTEQSYSTVRGWLLRMKDGDMDRRFDKKPEGRKPKIDDDTAKTIAGWLDQPPECYGFAGGTWQLAMVAVMLHRELGKSFNNRTLRRTLKRKGFSYTKARPISAKSASRKEQQKFKDVTNEEITFLLSQGYKVFFEDETGVLRWNSGGYGWRRTGNHDTTKISFSKQSTKVYGILGEDGYDIYPVSKLNSNTFVAFLKKIWTKYEKFVLILDNASYHTSGKVKDFIESTNGRIKLIFLPPHTPQLNAIEMQWRELKRRLAGRYFETVEELRNAIRQVARNEMKPVKVMDYITNRYKPN